MTRRAGWMWAAVGSLLVFLLVGRWLAVTTASRLWADAVGAAQLHADMVRLRFLLLIAVFATALAWCGANLYVVYRAVDAVNVPRRLGNLEIFEAVPRRYLRLLAIVVSLVLAGILARGSGEWWSVRALSTASAAASVTEPVLGRDVTYYLFQLPWHRKLHSFAAIAVSGMLIVTVALYLAMGAIRRVGGRLRFTESARVHLAALLALSALVLFWGYRLEPAELVGGIHGVPYDTVLTEVRLPTARLLALLAVIAFAGSLAWIWLARLAVPAAVWLVLGVASLLGHYVIPAFAGAVRSVERLEASPLADARLRLEAMASGMEVRDTVLEPSATPRPEALARYAAAFESVPIWDAFAVRAFLNGTMSNASPTQFSPADLGVYRDEAGDPVALYLAVRVFDFSGSRGPARDLSWHDVHVGAVTFPAGAAAVHAFGVSPAGTPRFVPDLERPDSATGDPTELVLDDDAVVFGPGNRDFAVVPAGSNAANHGVRVGGFWRRLALAWTLQSPQLIRGGVVSDSRILWHRGIGARLERVAPFARFGRPYPVVFEGRLYWVAPGYVASEAFPLSDGVEWRGSHVRYLRAGFVGLVEAVTGRTSVYLLSSPDPLSRAWADLAGSIVRPTEALPGFVAEHWRYPEELFVLQGQSLRRRLVPNTATGQRFAVRDWVTAADDAQMFWWFGEGVGDSVPRLRARMSVEASEPPVLAGVIDGTVIGGVPVLTLLRFEPGAEVPGPSQVASRFSRARLSESAVPGTLRAIPVAEGVVYVQSAYGESAQQRGAPTLVDVLVGWGGIVEGGPNLTAALRRVETSAPALSVSDTRWREARRWFERMDAARLAGDWAAFGRAYHALGRALTSVDDSVP